MTRGQGEGSLYQRKDGMWCASIEAHQSDMLTAAEFGRIK